MKSHGERNAFSLQIALKKLGGSWKLLVLRELCKQPRRFNDLRRSIPWISATSLARALKDLEEDGLISRGVVATRPPMVAYALLDNDSVMREIIEHLTRWGQRYSKRTVPPKP